ncbi:MAG: hypothetical protein IKG27_05960 [Bacilli bacterium]|nr:hypothetical protein [Bacilli bacterium]
MKNNNYMNKVRLLKKIIDAGYNTREKIIKMNMSDVNRLKGLTIQDFHLINELIPMIKSRKLLEFLTEM